MDPYLEQSWGDVQHTLIATARAGLKEELPRDLVARVDERTFVEPTEGEGRNIVPDVRVVERPHPRVPKRRASNGIAVSEPLVIVLNQSEPLRQGFIEIIDIKSGHRVVTVIEVLSPSNKKAGPGRELYVKKQEELREGGVSLVEIDLLRGGTRVLAVPFDRIPEGRRTPYAVCSRRGWKSFEFEFFPIPLRERLPVIPIPLRRDDPDAVLDLQVLIDGCYETGRYDDDIDYREEPEPPLSGDDARWADALLREQGRR
jgi:hypothetical protein